MSENQKTKASVSLQKARIQGHSVPSSMRTARGSATTFMKPEGALYLSHAEKVKTLLSSVSTGVLSTNHFKLDYPYGSVINLALDEDGKPFTFLSKLAEHTANLLADSRSSILVSQVQGQGDKLATARATLLGRMNHVDKTADLVQKFMQVHPGAYYAEFSDFIVFKLEVERIRYIGGFGEMSWVGKDRYLESDVDPIANSEAAKRAVAHMNEDHKRDVLSMSRVFAGVKDANEAIILGIDRYGFDVLCNLPDGKRRSRVTFESRLNSSEEIKSSIIALTQRARERESSL